MFDEIYTGEFHNLPNFLPVAGGITVGFTLLTHRLGVIGAQE